ncbi:hypothetical protein TNCV_3621451 [Trichonephila clavipes]|nr:hypothetical protein TNCV_3621451 [Trichonephila clavipes]
MVVLMLFNSVDTKKHMGTGFQIFMHKDILLPVARRLQWFSSAMCCCNLATKFCGSMLIVGDQKFARYYTLFVFHLASLSKKLLVSNARFLIAGVLRPTAKSDASVQSDRGSQILEMIKKAASARCSLCSSSVDEATSTSSRYGKTKSSPYSTSVMKRWKVEGAFLSPKTHSIELITSQMGW